MRKAKSFSGPFPDKAAHPALSTSLHFSRLLVQKQGGFLSPSPLSHLPMPAPVLCADGKTEAQRASEENLTRYGAPELWGTAVHLSVQGKTTAMTLEARGCPEGLGALSR